MQRALNFLVYSNKLTMEKEQVAIDLLAGMHVERVKKMDDKANLFDAEFKVSSQFGEDGIIQYIINKVHIRNKIFVEFGVENYLESNTRFLLRNNNWKGLVIDGSDANIQYIKTDEIYWKHDLTAVSEFITKENINSIILKAGISGEIGLLSVDIDGNDYWVWEAIDCITPQIVICEYNSVFGCDHSITIPYNPKFRRIEAHHSGLYAGASLRALCELSERKGYVFIGSNSVGNNAFFIRKDIANTFNILTAKEGYVESKLRDSRDKNGKFTYLSGVDRLKEISECVICELSSSKNMKLCELFPEKFS